MRISLALLAEKLTTGPERTKCREQQPCYLFLAAVQVAGDGDCGITFARGAAAVVELKLTGDLAAVAAALAGAVSSSMGGTSGALLEIAFRAAHVALKACPHAATASSPLQNS